MGTAEVQYALQKLTSVLDAAGIPYAIAGAMALNHHGYRRVTVAVDVLLTRDGLDRLKHEVLGRGYVVGREVQRELAGAGRVAEHVPVDRGVRDLVALALDAELRRDQ
jgi:hypothetical protein